MKNLTDMERRRARSLAGCCRLAMELPVGGGRLSSIPKGVPLGLIPGVSCLVMEKGGKSYGMIIDNITLHDPMNSHD
ncbi:MAG: hypothetical protein ABIG63_11700 [Chloroflexota bacterium]